MFLFKCTYIYSTMYTFKYQIKPDNIYTISDIEILTLKINNNDLITLIQPSEYRE
jgi:hypothetical protein